MTDDRSAPEGAARLTAALSDRYRIERELGQGGMATVYLAHDLKHERDVAIKVLHADLGAALGPDRFLSEIKTTAKLQHPHILPLLDSGSADGLLYYVMPLVTGETLRARLERERQLPIDDAVRIAREAADALGYAHALGIIHRDIKPENILLQGGHALVADFGIALAVQSAGGARMTQTGLSLGTPQYMSPEQAMGERAIDARSDIYALGAVTYEMLVGEPPFTGPSVQAIVARLITEEPRSISAQRKAVPDHVEAAVLHALEKLPADRFATAPEFAVALVGASTSISGPSGTARYAGISRKAPAHPSRLRDPVVLLLGALALSGALAAAWAWQRPGSVEPQVVTFSMPVPRTGSSVLGYSTVAIARDGQLMTFIGVGDGNRQRLHLRRLDDMAERPLPGTEDGAHPVFSPNGRWVAFIRGNQLFKIAIDGAQPQLLGTAPGTFNGMSWSNTGNIVVSANTGLYLLPEGGGAMRELTRADTTIDELYQDTPMVVDDAGIVLYSSWKGTGPASARIALASMSDGKTTVLDVAGIHPLGIVDGTLVYVSPVGAVMGVAIDVGGKRLTGAPVQLLTDVAVNNSTGIARAALSQDGHLIYEQGTGVSRVVRVDMKGGQRPLIDAPREYAFPRLSPDGRSLAITIGSGGRRDVWIFDLQSGTSSRLTSEGTTNERPEWSPDGKRVLYRTDQSARASMWWRPVDRSAVPTALLEGPRLDIFEAMIAPGGEMLVYQLDTLGADIYARRIAGDTTPIAIAADARAIETMPRISPDGRWVAFVTDESGVDEVVVQPFPGPGGRVQVSSGGGTQPVWSGDGRRLFFRGGGRVTAAAIAAGTMFVVTSRENLFADDFSYATNPHANFDVTADGTGLIMLRPVGESRMVVVANFAARMRSLMAAGQSR